MIEQGFNYADSSVKEMTDFLKNKVENSEEKQSFNIQISLSKE